MNECNVSDTNCDVDSLVDFDVDFVPPRTKKCALISPPSVRLKIPSTPKSHSRCFICKKAGPKLIVVTADARFSAFTDNNVIIKNGTRCCPTHMADRIINRSTVFELLTKLREACKKCNKRFDFSLLEDEEYVDLTGINKEAFDDLCTYLDKHIRNTPTRDVKTTLGVFLFKLKAGLSNKLLSIIFGISKSSVRRAVSSVRVTLKEQFVPHHLGVNTFQEKI